MKNFRLILLTFASAFLCFTSCDENELEPLDTNYITFESDRNLEVVPDGTSTFDVKVYSTNISGAPRTLNVVLSDDSTADPSTYNLPSTVTIPANTNVGVMQLSITDVDLNLVDVKTIILNLVGAEGLSVDDGITLSVSEQCLFNKVVLNITFDDYPGETSWEIRDGSNTVIQSNSYSNEESTSETFCLESGSYTFIIYDAYGDGICCTYGNGSYSLSDANNSYASGGSFGASESTSFTID